MERFDRPFRGGVEADERHRANSEPAGDTENVSAALLPQQWQSGTEDANHSEIVRVEQVANLLVACFLHGREQADTGIVNENVQPPEVRERLRNHPPHLFGIGDVEGEGLDRIAEALGQIGDVCQIAGGSCDLVAPCERGFSPDAAETARGAREEPCLLSFSISLWSAVAPFADAFLSGADSVAHSELGKTHVLEIGEERGAGWVPAQLFPGSRAGDRAISPREEPEKSEMLLGLFL